MPTVTLKQGPAYSGTLDTTLYQAAPNQASGSATTLYVDGNAGADTQTLLAFQGLFGTGPGQIPIGATITSATLTFNLVNASTTGGSLYRMLLDWDEQASWNFLGNGVQHDGIEAVTTADLVTGAVSVGTLALDVTGSVRAWLSGATTVEQANDNNNGWLFTSAGTDGWDFRSSESSTPPSLTVTYTVPGSPGPATLALAGPVSAAEGTAGTATNFAFTVNRSGDLTGSVTANYSLKGSGSGAATALDFASGAFPSGTVSFAAGETSKTILIPVIADSMREGNEAFTLTLSGATGGAQITTATAKGTIVNDDPVSTLQVVIHSGSSFGSGGGSTDPNRFGSTDPTDIAYNPATGRYFIVDSEVDESPFHARINLFEVNGDGSFRQGYSLRGFTSEPTGIVAWNQQLFITDDDQRRIFVVDTANPATAVRSFSTLPFGATDPEDLSIDPANGNLFVLSEPERKIFEITQAGVLVSTIALPASLTNPEALAFDAATGLFYVSGKFSADIFAVSRDGWIVDILSVLRNYSNPSGTRVDPKGLEVGPSSDGSGTSLWVTDYGKDQVADGRLMEIQFGQSAAPASTAMTALAEPAKSHPFDQHGALAQPDFDLLHQPHGWHIDQFI
jgi:hypothetical protein